MASTTQEKLYETFVAVSGGQLTGVDGMMDASEEIARAASQISKVMDTLPRTITQAATSSNAKSVKSIVDAVTPRAESASSWKPPAPPPYEPSTPTTTPTATATQTTGSTTQSVASTVLQTVFGSSPIASAVQGGSEGSGLGSTLESIATTVLKSGLGIVPLIGGLLGLFGGGGDSAPAAPVKYAMPAPIDFAGADVGSGIASMDFDQMGMPRAIGETKASAPAAAPQQTITVNVQAMDARSFLDRSSDIAAAVRDAILNSNAINDAISEI